MKEKHKLKHNININI